MATKREPSKNKSDNKSPSKTPEKKPKKSSKSKGGGLFSFLFTLIILLVLIGVGYYGYIAYGAYQKNGGNSEKTWDAVKGKATKDYKDAAENTTKYSTIAYNKTTEWSADAYKNSEEYLATVKEFTKESFNDLSEKMKKIGEKTPEELSNSADNYLKEFMSGKEIAPAPVKKEEVVYKAKDNEPVETDKKTETPVTAKKTDTPEPKKVEKKEDLVKDNGFVTPEKTKEEPVVTKEPKKETPVTEEPKKKGFTKVGEKIGPKNEDAITKSEAETKTSETKKSSEPVKELPHMKTYKEGKALFMQGLEHYKKQMPGQPNEHVHRRQAYALFKKAAVCFDKIDSKMANDPEFVRISTDNHRFMFGCGKSMLVDQH